MRTTNLREVHFKMELLKKLESRGYSFWLDGKLVKFEYSGPGGPDPDVIKPLLEELKQRKDEVISCLQARGKELRRKLIPFPYPINETMGIGDCDPLDFRYIDGNAVINPGWWKGEHRGE